MTEPANHELVPALTPWLDTWQTALQQTLSQVSGQNISLTISPDPVPPVESDLWYLITATGSVPGEMTFRLPSAVAVRLAQMFMGETEPASNELTSEYKEALEELLRQIAGLAATALASLLGELQIQVVSSAAPSWPAAATVCLRRPADAPSPLALEFEIQVSADLLSALQARPPAQPAAAAPASPSTSSPSPSPASPPSLPPPLVASYDRLMDVGLEVKLRFGSRHMVLRDVLALSAGVVVELDRTVNAPVDLLLDGRIIAQGEVVVVEGKYGLRITAVQDPGSAA